MSLVLVIDDDPQVRTWIRDVLEMEGLEVTSAADGRRALHLASRQTPSVALVDVTLPMMDGTAVSTALRALLGERFPIVLMSADDGVGEKAALVAAAAYLQKPFTMDDLLGAIQAGLSGTQHRLDWPPHDAARGALPCPSSSGPPTVSVGCPGMDRDAGVP